jgi:uncharacterized protein YutE (UPF0331/DUF86 family)
VQKGPWRWLRVVDSAVVAAKIAQIRDASERIQSVLPPDLNSFRADRTTREVVTLNLFVAIQECIALTLHLVADAGWGPPKTYAESFTALADHNVVTPELAARMRSAAGLRNLLAHQYGVIDLDRLYQLSSTRTDDFIAFCAAVANWVEKSTSGSA